jgi:hypothetical protein
MPTLASYLIGFCILYGIYQVDRSQIRLRRNWTPILGKVTKFLEFPEEINQITSDPKSYLPPGEPESIEKPHRDDQNMGKIDVFALINAASSWLNPKVSAHKEALAAAKLASGLTRVAVSTTATIAAGKTVRIQSILDIKNNIANLIGSDDQNRLITDNYQVLLELDSTSPFIAIPVLVAAESGETFSTLDDDETSGSSPHAIYDAILSVDHSIKIGQWILPRKILDNGTRRYVASQSIDLTQFHKQYEDKYCQKEIEGESIPEYRLHLLIYGVASQTVEVHKITLWHYHNAKRPGLGFV